MYMHISHYFNCYLPDFVTAIHLGFIFGFSFWGMCFNLTQCHNKLLVESSFLTRDQDLSLWSGNIDSKILDYQRNSPREYQIVRTHTKDTTHSTQHHPNSSSTLCRTPHLNNKQNKNTKPLISRQDYHLTQPCPSGEKQGNKQTKTQHKSHPILKLHKTLDQP